LKIQGQLQGMSYAEIILFDADEPKFLKNLGFFMSSHMHQAKMQDDFSNRP
jgi:hypothetical protein